MIKTNYTLSLPCPHNPPPFQITPSIADRVSQIFAENQGIIGCAVGLGAVVGYVSFCLHEEGDYEGPRKFGLRHGKGTLVQATGLYTGDFRLGRRAGNGFWTSKSGTTYDGQFLNGQPHGKGTVRFSRQEGYIHIFNLDLICTGRTTHDVYQQFLQGESYSSVDRILIRKTQYVGDFAYGRLSGTGVFTYANEDVYEGQVFQGKKHGKGTYTYADGGQYIGDFSHDEFTGQATLMWEYGRKYTGSFVAGEWRDGVLELPDGSQYEGTFTQFKFSGKETSRWESSLLIEHAQTNLSMILLPETQACPCPKKFFQK